MKNEIQRLLALRKEAEALTEQIEKHVSGTLFNRAKQMFEFEEIRGKVADSTMKIDSVGNFWVTYYYQDGEVINDIILTADEVLMGDSEWAALMNSRRKSRKDKMEKQNKELEESLKQARKRQYEQLKKEFE